MRIVSVMVMMVTMMPVSAQVYNKIHVFRNTWEDNIFINVDTITFSNEDVGEPYMLVHTAGRVYQIPVAHVDRVTFHQISFCPDDNHPHLIDLNLISGTKWACCNVGTAEPTGFGGYYAWGETEEKKVYDLDDSYLYYVQDSVGRWGFQDLGSSICGTDYDVAHMKWGGDWQMPSKDQILELITECDFEWVTLNGVNGACFTGSSGNSVFLPATGICSDSTYYGRSQSGSYWTGTQSPDVIDYAYSLYFDNQSSKEYIYSASWEWIKETDRIYGFSIRPVIQGDSLYVDFILSSTSPVNLIRGEDYAVQINSGNGFYSVKSSNPEIATAEVSGNWVDIYAAQAGTSTVTVSDTRTGQSATIDVTVTSVTPRSYVICPDDNHPHLIDLGLPSGTKWACCNVRAEEPIGNGCYYAWGETCWKPAYYGKNYHYTDTGSNICGTDYDVAHERWGDGWQMPSFEQIKELVNNCAYEWTTLYEVNGGLFTGPSGNSIFLPTTGQEEQGDNFLRSFSGYYWTGTKRPLDSTYAYYLYFDRYKAYAGYAAVLSNGHTVRPVGR